ncbi:MAG TPA: sodium-translocating pyrophosphatase [Marinilabiliales bacterium]|jgi:K(+)-stimulated pyrophosphate-energized sodium pump|nr:MAG: sodium-translocating pyrophosphatase [Bacteroidetes bacterium GWA2_40_14]OFX61918.1 MAG: sodium-translocating pyrophosphatase [Bacteroidetes bacterium GWC2_40_13]OFX74065.1 MAG: sodium-translocating pyrophosphatase [Bacteroidetes bacterium GWD2_40_43]OFX93101.1 MAG: sodium-translocating pyrophosphatase [Bacteroidetes bacterium GWE2_40_63]OFY21471.1 MAG: sodium-translocating pyrophosphatase [Bacteroidetes bacterium GWF2_40_13]OFZ25106.1 MAG: sodium-translocating pyrophosphatase [Bactero
MENINGLFWLVPVASITGLAFAFLFFKQMMKEDEGTDLMKKIAQHVRTGAMAYLRQQYKVVTIVFIILSLLFVYLAYGLHTQNPWVPFAFLTGGFFSGLAGFFGMKTATYASARTANAAMNSLNHGLRVAFRSGAVMGLVVVGLALLDISLWYLVLNHFVDATGSEKMIVITTTMLTFGMGASTQALFARVGGGIYTKAADVGADLVGKVEAGIPEDDPRNPATIADNVGDNVGDVAGMGADLYESYCGSVLATAAIGAAAFMTNEQTQFNAVLAPMLIAAVGIFLSIIGIYFVRTKEGASMKQLLRALGLGVNISSVLIAIASFGILYLLGLENWVGISFSVVVGLLAGIIIGQSTEYFTSHSYRPTQRVAESSQTGPATVIISGVGLGMISTAIPVITISLAIVLAYLSAIGFDVHNMISSENIGLGLYGIGIAAVGMLSTLGITLATDAYGPIADNAGGNAEMSHLGPEVRKRTDALDALGNTTAATGKGFAIGSAALTALALLASYIEEIKIGLVRLIDNSGSETIQVGIQELTKTQVQHSSIIDFMNYYQVTLMNPIVIVGIFIGSMMAFLFTGLTMNAVGRAAQSMVEEVRRQFREIKGILTGDAEPDYARCVAISTKGAQREMMLPSLLAIIIPIVTGLVFGVAGVMGLLAGGLGAGFVLAVFMANAGGAWDNAKKYIEEGNLGGKGSANHKAAVTGDTVGDPFKDTSGPSLNILIKLMSMVSIVMAGVTVAYSLF